MTVEEITKIITEALIKDLIWFYKKEELSKWWYVGNDKHEEKTDYSFFSQPDYFIYNILDNVITIRIMPNPAFPERFEDITLSMFEIFAFLNYKINNNKYNKCS